MTVDTTRSRAARIVMIIYSLAFLSFGIEFLFLPAPLAEMVGIRLTTTSAFADLRALYGGLTLGVGVMFLQALRDPQWLAPSLFLALLTTAGPASARLYSIAVSGVPNALVLSFLAIELVSFVWTLRVYRAFNAASTLQLRMKSAAEAGVAQQAA